MVIRLFDPWLGGTQKQAHRLARALLDEGVDVQLATGWWFRGTRQRETIDGIPVFRNHTLWEGFGIRGARTFGGYVYILTLLWHLWRRRRTYDVIHVHGLSYHTFAAAIASRWLHKPMVTKLANSGAASDILKMRGGQHLALTRFMLPTALRNGRFVALNRAVERELLDAGVQRERITTIPNGIGLQVAPGAFDARLHRPARALFVGRLHHQKGVDVLLRAARRLRELDPQLAVAYRIVGDGPLRDELSSLTRELGLTKEVEFWGERGDVPGFLRDTDVFVLPSRAEGISNALLEAMSLGLPVIASAVPGNEDVVEHEREGLLFPVDDPESLATAIRRVLRDADLRERLGRHARRAVESRYPIERVADRYRALYRELMDGPTPGREPDPMLMAPTAPEAPRPR